MVGLNSSSLRSVNVLNSVLLLLDPLKRLLKKIDIQRDRWKSEMKSAKDIEERRTIAGIYLYICVIVHHYDRVIIVR